MTIHQILASVVSKLRPHSSRPTASHGEVLPMPINSSLTRIKVALREDSLNSMWVFMLLIAPALENMPRQKIEIRNLGLRWKIHIATSIK